MSGDSSGASSPRPLGPTEFAAQLDWDLRAAGTGTTLRRLDRSQVPMLPPVHPGPDLVGGRHAADQIQVRRELARHYAEIATWTRTSWVRVVEPPPRPQAPHSPDMQRELDALQLHAECGARVRVVTSAAVTSWERGRRLPDLLTIGSRVVYRLVRGASGELLHAFQAVDPWLAAQWDDLIETLFMAGEEVPAFFAGMHAAKPATGIVLGQPPRSPDADTVRLPAL